MPEPGLVAPLSNPSAMAPSCGTSDAGSGYVSPPSTAGRAATAATPGSTRCDAPRDGADRSNGENGDTIRDSGRRGSSHRQRPPPSISTEKNGSKAAETAGSTEPTATQTVRSGGGGVRQWVNNAGKRASGKLSRARKGVGGRGRSRSPKPGEGGLERGEERSSLVGQGNDRISDFIARDAVERKPSVDQRPKAFTTSTTEADQQAASDCSSSEEHVEVGRSEMLAWATAAGGGGYRDDARDRRPARPKARYRRTPSSGSSRESQSVAAPRSTAGTGGDVSSRPTPKGDSLAGAEARRQAPGAEEEEGRNGESDDPTAEGGVQSALGEPATATSRAWSWKNLALAKTSTASTSATSINSTALGPSYSPQSEVNGIGSAGSGASGGGGSVVATAGYRVSSSSSPLAPPLAPASESTLAAVVASGAVMTTGSRARDSPIVPVARGASGKKADPDKKVSSGTETRVNAAAAAAAAAAARAVGTPSSRPPPVPASSTTRSRVKTPNLGGDGEHAGKKGSKDGQRYPMDPPSPNGSACGPSSSDASGAGEGTDRRQQPEAGSKASRTSASANGSGNSTRALHVNVDVSSDAGGFNCLDSAGGGSFEIEAYDNGSTAIAPTPKSSSNNNDDTKGMDEEDEGSDSLDSGFGSVASPGETIGGMTEGEIVAAAEAAMNSAKKAAAGAAPGTHTPRSRLLLATADAHLVPASETSGETGAWEEVAGNSARSGGVSNLSGPENGTTRHLGEGKGPPVVKEGGDGSSTRRTIRDDNWWRDGAAKALAASAESKKTPSRSRSGTPGRSRSRAAGAAGGAATARGPKGTPSTRGGSRRGDRAGGGSGIPGGTEAGGGSGGSSSSIVEGGFLSPGRAAAETEVSPTFSTISSREQAERDRERLAAIAGNRSYRRSSWGVSLPSNGNTNGDSNSVTGTPDGYGTDEGHHNTTGARSSRRGSRASYHSVDSSGWGLTSDDGGDGESQPRRWRPSLTSSIRSDGGGGSATASSGAGQTPSSSTHGSSASAGMSVFSDDEGSSSSRSSISTGYESSAKGEEHSATDRTEEWSGGREESAPAPSPPGRDTTPQDGDGALPGRDSYPPPSPAGSPQTHAPTKQRPSSMSKLERSALKKKAHYEKQANAAAGAAIAAAALAAAANATAASRRQSSQSFGDHSQCGSPSSNRGRSSKVMSGGRRGRMPSETRAILSRGGSLPEFDVFHPRSTSAGRGHARHVSGGDVGGGGTAGRAVGDLSAWPPGQAAAPNQVPLSRRVESTVSESARPRHASVEEAIAMAVAWTPSQAQRSSAGGGDSSRQGQSQQGEWGAKDERGGSAGQRRGEGGGGAEGERVSGSGGRARDSQYFFSSRGSSVRGMSPAGIVQEHQARHRNPSPAELRQADSNSNANRESNKRTNVNTDDPRTANSRTGSRDQRRKSRKPLPTPPTPQNRQDHQQHQRRQRTKRREETSSGGKQQQGRAPLTIPPLPKVLFRPPRGGTPRQRNYRPPQQQQQQQQQPSGARNVIAVGDAAGGGGGGGREREGEGAYSRRGSSRSIGDWPSFAGTPTSTSFSPSSAVANPFIATRYTQRSSLSSRSNSASQRGGGGSGPLRSGASEERVSPSSPIGRLRARDPPRAAVEKAGDSSRRRNGSEDHYGSRETPKPSSPPRGGRGDGASSSHRRTNSSRRRSRNPNAAAVDSGFVSDLGGDIGTRNSNSSSSGRPIFRTMSLRGRSLFSGGAGMAERRSVSMSSFGARGDPARTDGDYDRSQSWRGGGRGMANRMCSVLSVGWLFSRNSGKGKGKGKKRKKKKGTRNGVALGGVLDLSRTSSRRSSAYSGAGVVCVMDNGRDSYTSSEDDCDGDDVFEIGGPRDIAVGGGGSRRSGRFARGGGARGVANSNCERTGFTKADDGKTASEGGSQETAASAPVASVNDDSRNRLSFTRSGMLGLDRTTNSSMSSYSFVQHAPSRGASSATASAGGARTSAGGLASGADGGGGRRAKHTTDPSANVTIDGSGRDVKAKGNASGAAAVGNRSDAVQYVNFNGHGGRGGGVVALRGAGVAAVEIQGDTSMTAGGLSSMVESGRRPPVDEEEAKRRMETLLLRSRVHKHVNPTGAPGAGTPAHQATTS